MISADHWHNNGDDTAWLIVRKCPEPRGQQSMHTDCNVGMTILDRPCETCGGTTTVEVTDGPTFSDGRSPCPDCIDGQHTFEIQVQTVEPWPPVIVFPRVSIVPGMVLPIRDDSYECDGLSMHMYGWGDGTWAICPGSDVTLPPAAKPGMWAVKVRLSENVGGYND